ncbi:MAG: hypothetical protein FWG72_02935 [Oscillospiraceae bacterium]|nr:hypothetical protein [Oscillospiraceae bacterium]
MLDAGKDQCACSNTGCPRHGNCEECRKYHKSAGSQTGCQRSAKKTAEEE